MPNAIDRGREHAKVLRAEAKERLVAQFNVNGDPGFDTQNLERIVDCVISAAILEAAVAQYDAMEKKQNG